MSKFGVWELSQNQKFWEKAGYLKHDEFLSSKFEEPRKKFRKFFYIFGRVLSKSDILKISNSKNLELSRSFFLHCIGLIPISEINFFKKLKKIFVSKACNTSLDLCSFSNSQNSGTRFSQFFKTINFKNEKNFLDIFFHNVLSFLKIFDLFEDKFCELSKILLLLGKKF